MRQMMKAFEKTGTSVVALEEVERARTKDYGVIAGRLQEDRLWQVKDLVEKPEPARAPSNMAIIGRYILTPEIFRHLEKTRADKRGEIQLTNGLRSLLKEQPIHGYQFQGKRYDTGNKLGFLKATVEFALKRADLGEEFREYLRTLSLDGGGPPGR